MNSLVIVVLALVAAQAQAGAVYRKLHVEDRIAGGEVAAPHSLPYQAYVVVVDKTGAQRRCGGSLLTTSQVLTSARCVLDSVRITAFLGVHDVSEDEPTKQGRRVVGVTAHEDFNTRNQDNDIAILTLQRPVVLNEYVQLTTLPTRAAVGSTYAGEVGTVGGWGRTTDESTNPSEVLKVFSGPIISNEDCSKDHKNITPRQVCVSGESEQSTCKGDWGSPLVVGAGANRVQVGIVTNGNHGRCAQGIDGLYTRVSEYLDWIAANSGAKIH